MRIVGVVVALILVIAGLCLPAASSPLHERPPGVVGMGHQGYEITGVPDSYTKPDGTPVITIRRGQRLTFQNDSRWIHIVGPGQKGMLTSPGMGSMTTEKLLQENDRYSTAPWPVAGTYLITCTVYPDMNAEVVVLP